MYTGWLFLDPCGYRGSGCKSPLICGVKCKPNRVNYLKVNLKTAEKPQSVRYLFHLS